MVLYIQIIVRVIVKGNSNKKPARLLYRRSRVLLFEFQQQKAFVNIHPSVDGDGILPSCNYVSPSTCTNILNTKDNELDLPRLFINVYI